jgi:hypothetical protein
MPAQCELASKKRRVASNAQYRWSLLQWLVHNKPIQFFSPLYKNNVVYPFTLIDK